MENNELTKEKRLKVITDISELEEFLESEKRKVNKKRH